MGNDEIKSWNICAGCAEIRNWGFPQWPVTCTEGTCLYCNTEDCTLIPVVDFVINGKGPSWD